jgi:hypothetical protein
MRGCSYENQGVCRTIYMKRSLLFDNLSRFAQKFAADKAQAFEHPL